MNQDARAIYQQVLDDITEGILACDYDKIRTRIALPHFMVTMSAQLCLNSEEELRQSAMAFSHTLRQLGIIEYIRIAQECEFSSPTVIIGHHITYIRKDNQDVFMPYPSMCQLESQDGVWMMTKAQSAIDNNAFPIVLPDVPVPVPENYISRQEHMKIVQNITERSARALLTNDVDEWLSFCDAPITVISREALWVLVDEDDIRAEFSRYQRDFQRTGVTDIFHTITAVQPVDARHMIGVYRTHVLRGPEQAMPAWWSTVILRQTGETWRVITVVQTLGKDDSVIGFGTHIRTSLQTSTASGNR